MNIIKTLCLSLPFCALCSTAVLHSGIPSQKTHQDKKKRALIDQGIRLKATINTFCAPLCRQQQMVKHLKQQLGQELDLEKQINLVIKIAHAKYAIKKTKKNLRPQAKIFYQQIKKLETEINRIQEHENE